MTRFVDPRIRMRNALRQLVQQERPARDAAALAIFRNRLLDETGSDARPLAELLLEAIHRGWLDALPTEPIPAARWDALTSPFVMRWSAERFVQPEMARWAAESWGFALGAIPADWLRIAPPFSSETTTTGEGAAPSRAAPSRATQTVAFGATKTHASASAPAAASAAVSATGTGIAYPRTPSLGRTGTARANTKPSNARPPIRSIASTRPSVPPLNPKLVRNLVICAASAYLFFIGQMVVSIRKDRATERATAQTTASSSAPSQAGVAESPPTAPPQSPAAVGAAIESSASSVATERAQEAPRASAGDAMPGVPAITLNALPGTAADTARLLIVEPARRASGASRPQAATGLASTRTDPIVYDEVQLTDGTRMVGRVDIIRAGTVVFRDMRSGLRHEIRKDDIEQITTEFGTTVKFRTAEPTPAVASRKGSAPRSAVTSLRATGVAGRYAVRYDAAKANGSKECTSVWRRTPQTVDYATVMHIPNADTLNIAFDGGDNFPSNIDHEGYFASTPRIMPDQARTSTALVTRLNGRFSANGSLSLTVSIVFFRRTRVGPDLACTVYVNATGEREKR